jgi:hypothetical protein
LSSNPIARGLAPILDKPLFAAALAEQADKSNPLWVAYDNIGLIPQAFGANGIQSLGGNNFAPNIEQLQILDPAASFTGIWNRYARISFKATESNEVTFQLSADDAYQIIINPCSNQLRQIGVTNVSSTEPLSENRFPCLISRGNEEPVNGVYLYSLKSPLTQDKPK